MKNENDKLSEYHLEKKLIALTAASSKSVKLALNLKMILFELNTSSLIFRKHWTFIAIDLSDSKI